MRTLLVLFLALFPTSAWAFCGFYVGGGGADLFNDATQAVLVRSDNRTVLSMQNAYEGPLENFAMVVPVPQVLQKESVKTLEKALFDRIDTLSAPRLVEYWERDPCQPPEPPMRSTMALEEAVEGAVGGAPEVVVRAKFSVAEYDIVVLETNEATALDKWLKTNKYTIPDGAAPYFQPYVQSGMYFFVAKVDATKVKYVDGRAVLSPLRFEYTSDDFTLPVRLGMINSKGAQDLIVYILAENQRYEVANYPNVFIPTNLEVQPAVKTQFGAFYQALFSRTVEENPKAVVTEYSWQATSCDPCPGGNVGGAGLSLDDLASLGAPTPEDQRGWGGGSNWTLTRLHARYTPDQVGEDLVFRKASAITGGREVRTSAGLETGHQPSDGLNEFQGRYIIRNEWKGEAKCSNPRFGIWEGPPATVAQSPNTAGTRMPVNAVDLSALLKPDAPSSGNGPAGANAADTPVQTPPKNNCATVGGGHWLALLLVGLLRRRR